MKFMWWIRIKQQLLRDCFWSVIILNCKKCNRPSYTSYRGFSFPRMASKRSQLTHSADYVVLARHVRSTLKPTSNSAGVVSTASSFCVKSENMDISSVDPTSLYSVIWRQLLTKSVVQFHGDTTHWIMSLRNSFHSLVSVRKQPNTISCSRRSFYRVHVEECYYAGSATLLHPFFWDLQMRLL